MIQAFYKDSKQYLRYNELCDGPQVSLSEEEGGRVQVFLCCQAMKAILKTKSFA